MKHLLKLQDLSQKEILELLNIADQLKFEKKNGIAHPHLAGKAPAPGPGRGDHREKLCGGHAADCGGA